jgi:hypothetical protein
VRVREVWEEGLWMRYRTRDALRTLEKIARRGNAAIVQYEHGWIRLTPEDVEEVLQGEEVLVPFFLEPPRFQGARPYALCIIGSEDLW